MSNKAIEIKRKEKEENYKTVLERVKEELIYIKSSLSEPENKHEKRFHDYLCKLIPEIKNLCRFEPLSAQEFSDWFDEEMWQEFENDILEETGEGTLQTVFSDLYYSSVQNVRDAMLHVEAEQ